MFNNLELNVLSQLYGTMGNKLTLLKEREREVILAFKNGNTKIFFRNSFLCDLLEKIYCVSWFTNYCFMHVLETQKES